MKNISGKFTLVYAGSAFLAVGLSGAYAQDSRPAVPERAAERAKARIAELQENAPVLKEPVTAGTIRWTADKVDKEDSGHWGVFERWHYTKVVMPEGEDMSKAELTAVIHIGSLKTDNDRLTGHLLSGDFFTADKFPTATITVKNPRKNEAEEAAAPYIADAQLTMGGATHPMNLHFDIVEEKPLKVKGFATVNRQAHKVGEGKYSQEQSSIVDRVPIEFNVVVDPSFVAGEARLPGVEKPAEAAAPEAPAPPRRPERPTSRRN